MMHAFFWNGCTKLILFEEINFLKNSHARDLYHKKICNIPQQMSDSAYMGWLSLPGFVSCAITCYANVHFVFIGPNALTQKKIYSHSTK